MVLGEPRKHLSSALAMPNVSHLLLPSLSPDKVDEGGLLVPAQLLKTEVPIFPSLLRIQVRMVPRVESATSVV